MAPFRVLGVRGWVGGKDVDDDGEEYEGDGED